MAQSGLRSILITQLIAVVGFVGVPAAITAIAPVSRITYQKDAAGVAATVQRCLFFVVPYSTVTVSPVTEFQEEVIQGRAPTNEERRRGHGSSESEGLLTIRGLRSSTKVSVSPVNLHQVLEQSQAYLKAPTPEPLTLTVVANWKFSVIVGGIATSLTLLYVVGVTLGIGFWLLRKASPGGTNHAAGEASPV